MTRAFALLRFLLACMLCAPPAFAQVAIDKVLVVVNEEPIMLSEYQARHQRETLQNTSALAPFDGTIEWRILDRMINDRIQAQMAARRGLQVGDREIERAIAFMAAQSEYSVDELLELLESRGISAQQFRASLREQQLIRRLIDVAVNARVAVSAREVENYLASHSELLDTDEAFEASHIFISLRGRSEEEAQSEMENLNHIRSAIVDGRSFAESAREFSDSPNAKEGGYLGWRRADQLPAPLTAALRELEAGGVSDVLRGESGLHLLQLHARKSGGKVVEQQLVRHILLRPGENTTESETAAFAEELRAQLKAGADFEKLARIHSVDRTSRVDGGLLGWINPGDLPEPLENMVRALPLNQVSAPFRTRSGYHLVEVLQRRESDISYQLAQDRARNVIFRRKASEFYDNWYGTLRDTAFIEYVAVNPG